MRHDMFAAAFVFMLDSDIAQIGSLNEYHNLQKVKVLMSHAQCLSAAHAMLGDKRLNSKQLRDS